MRHADERVSDRGQGSGGRGQGSGFRCQGSGSGVREMKDQGIFQRLEDLVVYQRLCRLHIEISDVTHRWPAEEKFELASQARRSSNSAAAQLAEKYDDRHVRNKIEGVNRSRGEAAETIHHLFMAHLKGYETRATYDSFHARYQECIRMLNGMERTLEIQLPEADRRWPGASIHEEPEDYGATPCGYPVPDPAPLNPEPLSENLVDKARDKVGSLDPTGGRRSPAARLNPEP